LELVMRFKMMACVAAMSFAIPAMAQTDTAAPKPVKEKKVCRREAVTGSIIGTRSVCHTKTEWAAIDAANAGNAEGELTRGRQQGGIVGAGRNQ
jgi:predicted secreted protein